MHIVIVKMMNPERKVCVCVWGGCLLKDIICVWRVITELRFAFNLCDEKKIYVCSVTDVQPS